VRLSPRSSLLGALAAAVALMALIGALVSTGSSEPSATAGARASEGEAAAAEPQREAPSTTAFVPDVLPDPGVEPGTCAWVTYTPATAEDDLEGELCRPADAQRDVAVVIVHGGGGIAGSPASVAPWARRLNLEGYVTFTPAYHLFTPGSGEQPVFPQPEQNVKAAVQYLRGSANALGIERDRIAVQGHSAGARVGAVAFTSPDHPAFAGDELHQGISDRVDAFIGFYHPYDGTMQHAFQYYGGSDDSSSAIVRDRWDLADAVDRAAEADAPALLVTGSEDWVLIEDQQEDLAVALRRDRQLARTVVIDGGGHGFDQGGSGRLTLLGEEAAIPVLEFLNDVFPQRPKRPAASAEIDLSKAPRSTGSPATTTPQRTRRSTATTVGGRSAPRPTPPSTTGGSSTTATSSAPPASATSTTVPAPPSSPPPPPSSSTPPPSSTPMPSVP
jgi:acetyl esterase/lipase